LKSFFSTPLKKEIKKFLKIDDPRSRATWYYANFLALCATGISKYEKLNSETPEQSSEEFSPINFSFGQLFPSAASCYILLLFDSFNSLIAFKQSRQAKGMSNAQKMYGINN